MSPARTHPNPSRSPEDSIALELLPVHDRTLADPYMAIRSALLLSLVGAAHGQGDFCVPEGFAAGLDGVSIDFQSSQLSVSRWQLVAPRSLSVAPVSHQNAMLIDMRPLIEHFVPPSILATPPGQ